MREVLEYVFDWDVVLFLKIFQQRRIKTIDHFFRLISHSADGYWYVAAIVILLIYNFEAGLGVVLPLLIAFSIELPLYKIIKEKIKRSRPFARLKGVDFLITPPDQFSFPSGHTAAAFIMAIILSYHHPQLSYPLYFWASLVSLSRIYLGVHYPTDIFAGILLGAICSITSLVIS
jgi:undecaprenyl-diphosphatase